MLWTRGRGKFGLEKAAQSAKIKTDGLDPISESTPSECRIGGKKCCLIWVAKAIVELPSAFGVADIGTYTCPSIDSDARGEK
jgi:hypothetical protein